MQQSVENPLFGQNGHYSESDIVAPLLDFQPSPLLEEEQTSKFPDSSPVPS